MARLRSIGSAVFGSATRRSLRRLWISVHWWFFLGAAVAFFGLALWGYRDLYGNHVDWTDLVYASFATFRDTTTLYSNLKAGPTTPPFPAPLEWARFGAPLTLVFVGLSAVVSVFSEPFMLLKIRLFHRGHLVVCGLGQFGQRLVQTFDDRGLRVVAVDSDPSGVALTACRARAIPVVVGNATSAQVLRWAGVRRAGTLVAVCGNDNVNAEIGVMARRLVEEGGRRRNRGRGPLWSRKSRRLRCFVQVDDDDLSQVLESATMTYAPGDDTGRARAEIHFVNVFLSGPQILLGHREWFSEKGRPAHIVVMGTDRIGLRLVVGAARQWYLDHPGGDLRLRLTLIAPDADVRMEELRARNPHLDEACELTTHALDVTDSKAPLPALGQPGDGPTTIFVCFPEEATSLQAALRLARELPESTKIVTVNTEQSAKTTLLDVVAGDRHLPNVETFPLLDRVCQPEYFVDTVSEQLAMALHEIYLNNRVIDGTYDPAAKATHRTWEQVSEDIRESNRAAARGYAHHLRECGYLVVPVDDWDIAMPPFTEHEVDRMAQMEHDRWCAWMKAQGKRSADLVPWKDLPEAERAKDLQIIVELPSKLARLGLAVVRDPARQAASGEVDSEGDDDERVEELARLIHGDYVRRRLGEGAEAADPSLRPWEDLAETLKASNLDQARDIGTKLASIGCRMVPADAARHPVDRFEAAEVDVLAHLEHARWMRERLADGWRPGPTKDVEAKRSPYLVSWEQLSEDVRDLDRDTVRNIPHFLAGLGFAVVRYRTTGDGRPRPRSGR